MTALARLTLLALALALTHAAPLAAGEKVDSSAVTTPESKVEEILAKGTRELWFCAPENADPTELRRFCPLAPDAAARCPGLAKVCSGAVTAPPVARSAPRTEERDPGPSAAAASFSNLLFWALVAALVAFVVAQVVRGARSFRGARPEPDESPVAGAAVVEAVPPPAPKISDPERWLLLAEQAAEKGSYAAALRAAYSALMHALRGRGLIELESGQSNGDVSRALSSEPELARVFRGVSRELERIEFGGREATRQTFEVAYPPVKVSVKRLLASVSVLSFALVALGCSESGRPARAVDKGPEGYYLLRTLLSASGSNVKNRYLPLEELDESVERIVVTEALEPDSWVAILSWVSRGGYLVAAGVRDESFVENTGVETEPASCGPDLQDHPRKLRGLGRARFALHPDQASDANVPVVCGGEPYWVDIDYGDGAISLVAEAAFLQNASLAAADNALFLDAQLNGDGAFATEFVGEFTGAAASSPISSLRRSGLLPAVLQLLLLGAFFAWRYGAAFGERRDPIETSSRRFVEHVRVLGACYERARATRQVLAEYGGWLLERASRRALGGRRGDVAETAAVLSLRSGVPEGAAAELVAEVRIAQGNPDENGPDDLRKVREIESLVMKMGARF